MTSSIAAAAPLAFELPPQLEASAAPRRRDGVRLLVARPERMQHTTFAHLPQALRPGDLLVVNTSATLPAAVAGRRDTGRPVTVHFSTRLPGERWLVELRPRRHASGSLPDVRTGETITVSGGARLRLLAPHDGSQGRLWLAELTAAGDAYDYLQRHGRPIRYGYVRHAHPMADYQTVFSRIPGSAEMPSAGRPFTDALVTELVTRGVLLAPVTLHTGVSSLQAGEPPMPEWYDVSPATARLVGQVRGARGRIVAVGTTVTRALESAVGADGELSPGSGWTDLVLGPSQPAVVVSGLITGWHAPGASHLRLLQAVAGEELVARSYAEALRARYLWHEFGDSCLLLP